MAPTPSYVGGRFALEVAGVQVGYLQKVVGAVSKGAVPRELLGHELAHVAQQATAAKKPTWGDGFSDIVLKGCVVNALEFGRWLAQPTPQAVVLHQIDPTGRKLARYALGRFKPARADKRPAGGNEVAIESLELSHEGFR